MLCKYTVHGIILCIECIQYVYSIIPNITTTINPATTTIATQLSETSQYPPGTSITLQQHWYMWLQQYRDRIREDVVTGVLSTAERRIMQDNANPRYVLR